MVVKTQHVCSAVRESLGVKVKLQIQDNVRVAVCLCATYWGEVKKPGPVDTNANVSAIKTDPTIVYLHFFNRNSNPLDFHLLIFSK